VTEEPEARQPAGRVRAPTGARPAGKYDRAARRATVRRGRERGCWLYLPAEELERAGFAPDGPPPFSRVWSGPRGRVVVQLYKER
jgi:hypothetical protein